jgi:hypothetical protein
MWLCFLYVQEPRTHFRMMVDKYKVNPVDVVCAKPCAQ